MRLQVFEEAEADGDEGNICESTSSAVLLRNATLGKNFLSNTVFDHISVQLIGAAVGRSNNSAPRENDQRSFWCLFGVYYRRAPERL
jgi:hypothetical protein